MATKTEKPKLATDVLKRELETIRADNTDGLLKPEDVVTTAAHPDNPLHGEFTWDDTVAGHKYRLMQARSLIRRVTIINPEDLNRPPLPAYVSLGQDRARLGGGYRPTVPVVNNAALRKELLETAQRELQGWLKRNRVFRELCQAVAQAADIPLPE